MHSPIDQYSSVSIELRGAVEQLQPRVIANPSRKRFNGSFAPLDRHPLAAKRFCGSQQKTKRMAI
jgi:hypothetical protein